VTRNFRRYSGIFGHQGSRQKSFDHLESGKNIESFLDDFYRVKKEQVIKVLELSQRLIETSAEILNEDITG
jgi:hypothetical protein